MKKSEVVLIVFLNAVIAALVAVIYFKPTRTVDPAVAEPPIKQEEIAPTPHVKLREATAGRVDGVERETRLMGVGDETVVRAFFYGGKLYIFGNASEASLDFDEAGGFLCVIDGSGKMLSYAYFGEEITAAAALGNGFAAAARSLYFISPDGKVTKKAESIAADGEKVISIFPVSYGLAVITQPTKASLRLTEYSTSGERWTSSRSTRIESAFDLEYFDCYELGDGYVLAARARYTTRYDALAMYSFKAGGDATPHYYGGGVNAITPFAVLPYGGGYMAVAAEDGEATLLFIDYAFTEYHRYALGFDAERAALFFSGGRYYASFYKSSGATNLEIAGEVRTAMPALDGVYLEAVSGGVFAGERADGKKVISRSGKRTVLDFSGEICAFDGQNAVVTSSGGSALTEPSGGKDVYAIKLAFN